MRTGILLGLLGVFVIARSVTHDDTGRTLPDYILGKKPDTGTDPASGQGDPAHPGGGNLPVRPRSTRVRPSRRNPAHRPANTPGVGYKP